MTRPGLSLLLMAFLLTGMHSNAADPPTLPEADSFNEQSQSLVTLGEHAPSRAGIATVLLTPADYLPETIAYGAVIDITPLLEQRNRYFAASSERRIALAALQLSEKNLARLRSLYRAKAVARKKYLQQQNQWQTDQARVDAANYLLDNIQQTLLLHWGKTLTNHILDPDSALFRDLIGQQRHLAMITLPPEQLPLARQQNITVSPTGRRRLAMPAEYLAPSPQSSALTQGESYFILCDSPTLQTNMHITAWLTAQGPPLAGVIIPESAVVRHLGQTYVYLQIDNETFARRAIPRLMTIRRGYFVPSGISPGDKLVVAGAQMLLSEEFRSQIPDEDDD